MAQGMARQRERRTQAERTSETRRALCEAALDVLAEEGFEKATTTKIAARAGLSRGAQVHHFATKSDLIVAAFEHLLREWNRERQSLMERAAREPVSFKAYLDFQWQRIFGHPRYAAALELMLAARANDTLAVRLRGVLERWSDLRDEIWQQLFRPREPEVDHEAFLHLTRCVLRGMAVHASFNESDRLDSRAIALWSRIADDMVEPQVPEERARAHALRSGQAS
jgi:AcrR family transcriptional regulator